MSERPANQHVDACGLGGVVALVAEVGPVDDPRDRLQRLVVELVTLQKRLEAAVGAVMGQLDAANVEADRVHGDVIGILDEDERGVGVQETPDQPGAGGPIDVTACGSPTSSPSLSTLDQLRQTRDGPLRDAAFGRREEVARSDPFERPSQACGRPPPLGRIGVASRRSGVDHGPVVVGDRTSHARRQGTVLRPRGRLGDPDARLAALVLDLLRQPLELLACPGVERQRHETVAELDGAELAQPTPQRDPWRRRLARQRVSEEHPALVRYHEAMIGNHGCTDRRSRRDGPPGLFMNRSRGENPTASEERSEMPAKNEDLPSTLERSPRKVGYSGAERPPSSSVCRSVTLASSS
jgi:hypothetical protein